MPRLTNSRMCRWAVSAEHFANVAYFKEVGYPCLSFTSRLMANRWRSAIEHRYDEAKKKHNAFFAELGLPPLS